MSSAPESAPINRKRKHPNHPNSPSFNKKRQRRNSPPPILNKKDRSVRASFKFVEDRMSVSLNKILNDDFPVSIKQRREGTGMRHPNYENQGKRDLLAQPTDYNERLFKGEGGNNYLIEATTMASCCIERERQAMIYVLDHSKIYRKSCNGEKLTKREMYVIAEDAKHRQVIRKMHRAINI